MNRPFPWLAAGLLLLLILTAYFRVRPNTSVRTPAPPMGGEPGLMLWAWETPEDLRALDPNRAGVAYLSRELLLGSRLEVRSRQQRLLLPKNAFLMAVVRIETTPSFPWHSADIPAIAAQVAAAAKAPRTGALQIDFDARASERPFYYSLITDVRRQLPRTTSLSMTALMSWCGSRSWIHDLPIDEAVPMFFRMGGSGALRAIAPRSLASIREPHCAGSVGVATDELWPSHDAGQRIFIFSPDPWRAEQLAAVDAGRYEQLQKIPTVVIQGPHP